MREQCGCDAPLGGLVRDGRAEPKPRHPLVEVGGRRVAGAVRLVADDRAQERKVRRDPAHRGRAQGRVHPRDRGRTIGAPHDDLRQHRVVENRDLVTRLEAGVEAHARGARDVERGDRPGLRQKVVGRILGVQPRFDRPPARGQRVLREAQRLAGRDPQLFVDQVDAIDEFRHRMLDLQPGVHLEEVEPAFFVEDELDRPGIRVADAARRLDGGRPHLHAQGRIERDARRFLEHFLMTALDRTLAFAEVDARAVRVGEDLELDVPRAPHVPFEQHRVVAERRLRFPPRARERFVERREIGDDAHPSSAAAGARFDQQRRADFGRCGAQTVVVLVVVVVPGDDRDAGGAHPPLRLDLRTHRGDRVRRRADEDQAALDDEPRECRPFAQEAVAGMDRVGAEGPGGRDDPFAVEIRLGRRARAEPQRGIHRVAKERALVGVGVHPDR